MKKVGRSKILGARQLASGSVSGPRLPIYSAGKRSSDDRDKSGGFTPLLPQGIGT